MPRNCDTCSWIEKQYRNLPKNTEDLALDLTRKNHTLLFHYGEVIRIPADNAETNS